jgi:hypothetical protein
MVLRSNGENERTYIYIYIYIYTTSEKPVNDQSYGVLDRYGITILYK